MKKIILCLFVIIFFISLAGCGQSQGIVANAQVDIGTSIRFTQQEIEEAVERVKENFINFRGCDLIRLWYDEDLSNRFIESYMTSGRGRVNGVVRENVIVLLSDFKVDSSGGDGSFNPNSTYYNWMWVLIRDAENDSWRVDDWGY